MGNLVPCGWQPHWRVSMSNNMLEDKPGGLSRCPRNALLTLGKPEALHFCFNTSRGMKVAATLVALSNHDLDRGE